VPTRTVHLKLVVPRDAGEEATQLRRALWATHCFMNEAIAFYEGLLLEMRQEDVLVKEGDAERRIAGEEWRERLEQRLGRNGISRADRQGVLDRLQDVYRSIVKSNVKSASGSAQDSREWHSALVTRGSKAGQQSAARLELLIPLVDLDDDSTFEIRAQQVIEANRDVILKGPGTARGWFASYRERRPTWPRELREYVRRKRDIDIGSRVRWFQQRRVLPIAAPFGKTRIGGGDALSLFERSALALATGHLNSWESWRHATQSQHEARSRAVADWEDSFASSHRDALDRIRQWEADYSSILERESFWADDSGYRVRPRELRGWTELREWLRGNQCASEAERIGKVHQLQRDLGRRFGSERLLRWLAASEQQWLAEHPAGDVVSRVAEYNRRLRVLERTRELPLYTAPDAVEHPRWAAFDPPNNSNQPPFDIVQSNGKLLLQVELLVPDCDGMLSRRRFTLRVAPSGQLGEVRVGAGDGRGSGGSEVRYITCRSQDRLDRLSGHLGGSTLVLERRALSRAGSGPDAGPALGGVYFATVINHHDPETERQLKRRQPVAVWLRSGVDKRRATELERLPESFSVLAADIGLRSASAVAVLRVVPENEVGEGRRWPAEKAWPCADVGCLSGRCVIHERSTLLTLPGERPSQLELERRDAAWRQLSEARSGLTALAKLRRLVDLEPTEQREALIDELSQPAWSSASADAQRLLLDLRLDASASPALWRDRASSVFLAWERELGEHISRWRQHTRRRSVEPEGGKSAWRLQHLERVRDVLVRWHCHQRPWDDEPRRMDRRRWGTVARKLLEHINNLKDDRVKTTADLIVQAARGRVYRGGRWQQVYDPVDVIILEDLSRYRFRTDRPRFENSQLMRWAHRAVTAQVKQQADLYGLQVIEAPAEFSSRFDARTRAPGVRCEPVSLRLLKRLQEGRARGLERRLGQLGIDVENLRLADLAPTGYGELLASVTPEGTLRVVHADINAAQNLAARAIEGYAKPSRIFAVRHPQTELLYRSDLKKRLRGALGGGAVNFTDSSEGRGERFTMKVFKDARELVREIGAGSGELERVRIDIDDGPGGESLDDAELELRAANLEERLASDAYVVLFRDQSGRDASGEWMPHRAFWAAAEEEIVTALRRDGRLHGPCGTAQPGPE